MCGCQKTYECKLHSDTTCTYWRSEIHITAFTEKAAEEHCLKSTYADTYSWNDYSGAIDTIIYAHPICCECVFEEVTIFGVNYAN